MAKLGYKVLLVERLPFDRMNREWNISRDEFQSLIDLGLFTPSEFESVIAREYIDGFNKFFDSNNPPNLKAPVLHTPKVLNIGIDAEKLLGVCGEKLKSAIPGHFSVKSGDRAVAFNRIIAIGNATSLQSPLIFTGFGSLVRNLPRLTTLIDTALKHDLLDAASLYLVRAFQSNISVTWLFSSWRSG